MSIKLFFTPLLDYIKAFDIGDIKELYSYISIVLWFTKEFFIRNKSLDIHKSFI